MNVAPISPSDARRDLAALDAELAGRLDDYQLGTVMARASRTRLILDGLLAFHDTTDAMSLPAVCGAVSKKDMELL